LGTKEIIASGFLPSFTRLEQKLLIYDRDDSTFNFQKFCSYFLGRKMLVNSTL